MDNLKHSIVYRGETENDTRLSDGFGSHSSRGDSYMEMQAKARNILFPEGNSQFLRSQTNEPTITRDEAARQLGLKRRQLDGVVDSYTGGENIERQQADAYYGAFINPQKPRNAHTETAIKGYVMERGAITEKPTAYRPGVHTTYPSSVRKIDNEAYIMPSQNTMNYARTASFQKDVTLDKQDKTAETENEAKQSASLKTIAAIYISIVVVLATLIIATGMLIKNLNSDINALEQNIGYQNEILMKNNETLDYLSSDTFLSDRAKALGMVEGTEEAVLMLPPLKEEVVYEPTTNWFDKFCEFVSTILT